MVIKFIIKHLAFVLGNRFMGTYYFTKTNPLTKENLAMHGLFMRTHHETKVYD